MKLDQLIKSYLFSIRSSQGERVLPSELPDDEEDAATKTGPDVDANTCGRNEPYLATHLIRRR